MVQPMSNHAISDPRFKAQMSGYVHGSSRQPMDNYLLHNKDAYQLGYKDGQNAVREYSRKLCHQLGLIDPPITLKGVHRQLKGQK